jgi:Uma2 family endonuclease
LSSIPLEFRGVVHAGTRVGYYRNKLRWAGGDVEGIMPMTISIQKPLKSAIIYPDSDGQPMAENTLQFQWIVTIKEGLERVFRDRSDVFVAGDLIWYPEEGRPDICTAPDALVAFGRPKGYRGSYKQWDEGGIAPQAVFEVLSPGNRMRRMIEKYKFYEKYGVEEYYIYDPDDVDLTGYHRLNDQFHEISAMNGWTSPVLGIRFNVTGNNLEIYGPDGRPFLTYQEIADERDLIEMERDRVALERDRLALERDAERQRAERMADRLRAMGIEPIE